MITKQLMERLFPTIGLNSRKYNLVRERSKLVAALNRILPKYGIDNHKRICAFLGNCGIETDYFRTTEEYASGWDYDISENPAKAKKLGNYKIGDGPKYKGGGLTQTTGGFNYGELNKSIGKKLGIDFKKNPELLREDIEIAVESACIFWDDHKLNAYADRGEFKKLSAIVNRGDENLIPLHWAKRNELYSKCVRYVPKDFSFEGGEFATSKNYDDPTRNPQPSEISPSSVADNNPVAVTPTEPAPTEPAKEDSFLASAVDRNISADEMRTAARATAPRIAARFARPFAIVYAMLEAGNIYAWFGVAVGVIGLGLLIYWHRNDLKKAFNAVKNKILQ